MAFGFIGDIVEGLGDVVLGPKGTRGASIGGAIGGALSGTTAGAAVGSVVGSSLSSSIASGSKGQEAIATPTPAQSPRFATETAFSSANPGKIYNPQMTFVPSNVPPAVKVIKDVLGDSVGGTAMDLIPDINISKYFGNACDVEPKKI